MRGAFGALAVALMVVASGEFARSQEPRRPVNVGERIYRADNLGIEFQLVPHEGHYGAKLTRVVSATAPIYWVRLPEGLFQIEVGDTITRLDDQVIDGPRDLLNHVLETTVDFIDARTNLAHRGVMQLPAARNGAAPAPVDESRKVRALLVIDTDSGLDGVDQDRQNMRSLLARFERQGRAEVKVFEGSQDVNRDRIINYFRSQPDASLDTVLFYYSGHGATDPRVGHYLALANGPGLVRSDLKREIARLRPRLSVILTDCCSNSVPLPPTPGAPQPRDEVAYDLFFRARGTVDITAAAYDTRTGLGESGWGDQTGGFFTSALTSTIRYQEKAQLDTSGDGLVSWAEAFPALVEATKDKYTAFRWRALNQESRSFHPDMLQALRSQSEQRPQMFR